MNTDLSNLRRQMAELQPGRLTELTEQAAPLITKVVGYLELARSVLPALQRDRAPAPPPPPPPPRRREPDVTVVQVPWWRTLPWRRYAIGGGLAVFGGAMAYLGWRMRPRAR